MPDRYHAGADLRENGPNWALTFIWPGAEPKMVATIIGALKAGK